MVLLCDQASAFGVESTTGAWQVLGPKHPNALDGRLLMAECLLDLGRVKDPDPLKCYQE